jgi:serine/threonine protein kinase
MSPYTPDLTGKTLDGRYRLDALVGQGGFGMVYAAEDLRLGRRVAVKVIKPWWADDPEWTDRFEQEAQLAASLNHPGIVAVYDSGRDRRHGLFIVCELVDGESLAEFARRRPMAAATAAAMMASALDALAVAHALGIVHRDIKPQNVLVASGSGAVKVTDFGVARLAAGMTDSSASGTVVGTPKYMSPEQSAGRAVGPASDLYAVGVVLYELLAGRVPFDGENHFAIAMQHHGDPVPPLPASVPQALRDIVERALAKVPAQRFPTAVGMANALRLATDEDHASTQPIDRTSPTQKLRLNPTSTRAGEASEHETEAPSRVGRHRRVVVALAATVALAVVALISLQPWDQRDSPTANAVMAGTAHSPTSVAATPTPTAISARVPRLSGLSQSGARARARRYHLETMVESRPSKRVPSRVVISQSPKAGRVVDRGSTVTLRISTGPPPVEVPDVTGLSLAVAAQKLGQAGLHYSTTSKRSKRTPSSVLAQLPQSGSLPPGGVVALTVAEKPPPKPQRAVTPRTPKAPSAPARWHTVATTELSGEGSTPRFRIRGNRWRIHYTLTCSRCVVTPTLWVDGAIRYYKLSEGTHSTDVPEDPGTYSLSVKSFVGGEFELSVRVEDYS